MIGWGLVAVIALLLVVLYRLGQFWTRSNHPRANATIQRRCKAGRRVSDPSY